jgi:hypothetical protein
MAGYLCAPIERLGSAMAGKKIRTFCRDNEISKSFYYELKKRGLGPREMRLNTTVRITPEAEKEWQQTREAESGGNDE